MNLFQAQRNSLTLSAKLAMTPLLATLALAANGVLIIKGLIAIAAKGGGWLDYDWPDPVTKKLMVKSTYASPLPGGDGFVGVGVYK